jgi:hypothetical protein
MTPFRTDEQPSTLETILLLSAWLPVATLAIMILIR